MKKMRILFLAFVTLMVLGLTGCGGMKIDLMDYVTVEFSGIDGQGTAVCNVDTVKLEQDLVGDKDGEISREELEKLAWITQFEMTVSYQLDKETGLSNGDQVTVSVTCDEEFAKENKVNVSEGKKEFKVEGLKEPIKVDAFAPDVFDTEKGVSLEYEKASPVANLIIRNNCTSEPESLITYKADKTSDISNGDEIKITAELPAEAAEKGYILKETEQIIKVEGLDSYVTSLSQLNDAARQNVEEQLKKTFDQAAENRIFFHSSDGVNVGMYKDSTATYNYENLTFLEESYKTGNYNVTTIPFTIDIQMKIDWWKRPMDGITEKTFTGAYGHIDIADLRIDSDGNIVTEGELSMAMGDIYETKDALGAELIK